MVYARGKYYQNVEDLKVAIEKAWSTVEPDLLLTLYKSLPPRMHDGTREPLLVSR